MLNKFNFISFIESSSYNVNFLLQNKFTRSLWVGKISRRVKAVNEKFEIYDLNQRALLAYDLSKTLGIPMPQTKYINLQEITNNKFLLAKIGKEENYYNYDKIVITRFCGQSIKSLGSDQISKINKENLLKIFIFDFYIGNFDKKDDDYLIDNKNKLWTIDYQLWGPVDGSQKALGYCAENKYEFNTENAFKYCIAKKLKPHLSFINYVIEIFTRRIENLSKDSIKQYVNKYNFYYKDSKEIKINKEFIEYLCLRRNKIRNDLYSLINKNSL